MRHNLPKIIWPRKCDTSAVLTIVSGLISLKGMSIKHHI